MLQTAVEYCTWCEKLIDQPDILYLIKSVWQHTDVAAILKTHVTLLSRNMIIGAFVLTCVVFIHLGNKTLTSAEVD